MVKDNYSFQKRKKELKKKKKKEEKRQRKLERKNMQSKEGEAQILNKNPEQSPDENSTWA